MQLCDQVITSSSVLISVFVPPPTGAAGGGEETLWKRWTPAWRVVVYWIQTHSQLAEKDWRDPGSCVCQDQEHFLKFIDLCIFCDWYFIEQIEVSRILFKSVLSILYWFCSRQIQVYFFFFFYVSANWNNCTIFRRDYQFHSTGEFIQQSILLYHLWIFRMSTNKQYKVGVDQPWNHCIWHCNWANLQCVKWPVNC